MIREDDSIFLDFLIVLAATILSLALCGATLTVARMEPSKDYILFENITKR